MGGWKDSGLGSRHGPDGIRKYTKRQSLMITPGSAGFRDAHHFPYSAQVTELIGQTFAALATSDLFCDEQRVTLRALCDTFIPSLEPPSDDRENAAFWRRSASDLSVPESVEVALLGAELTEEQVAGLRGMLDALAEAGMAPATPREAREEIVHAFEEASPEALDGVASIPRYRGHPLLRLARPGNRAQSQLGRDGIPGADRAATGRSRATFECSPADRRGAGPDRGGRGRHRLRRGRRRDRR